MVSSKPTFVWVWYNTREFKCLGKKFQIIYTYRKLHFRKRGGGVGESVSRTEPLISIVSKFQSQCSSQERLHQIGIAAGVAAGIPVDGKIAKIANTDYQLATGLAAATAAANSSLAGTPVPLSGPGVEDLRSFHRHFSSNESNPSLIDDEGRRSPSIRPRSRSLRYEMQ